MLLSIKFLVLNLALVLCQTMPEDQMEKEREVKGTQETGRGLCHRIHAGLGLKSHNDNTRNLTTQMI